MRAFLCRLPRLGAAALLAAGVCLAEGSSALAQRGARSVHRPPSRPVDRTPVERIRGVPRDKRSAVEIAQDRLTGADLPSERSRVATELRDSLRREPTEQEIEAEIARRDRELKVWQEEQQRKDAEVREQLARFEDGSRLELLAAKPPPPGNVRVRLRAGRKDGKPVEFAGRLEAEAWLRESRTQRLFETEAEAVQHFRTALGVLDAALFRRSHAAEPAPQDIRSLRYDPAAHTLSVYSSLAPGAAPDITWHAADLSGPSLAALELRVFVRNSGRMICYCPEVPELLRAALADTGIDYVRGVERSANAGNAASLLSASVLGERPFVPEKAELHDGLPVVRSGLLGLWDTWRMKLPLADRHRWRRLRSTLKMPERLPVRPATARGIHEALRAGRQDLLIVVAHNDGAYVYLPGGERIAFSDVAAIRRSETPERSVILFTCEAGAEQSRFGSLAGTILQNRLARAVFATEKAVDANQIEFMLRELAEGRSIRAALRKYEIEHWINSRPRTACEPLDFSAQCAAMAG